MSQAHSHRDDGWRKGPGTQPAQAPWTEGAQTSRWLCTDPGDLRLWLSLCPSPSWPAGHSLSPSKVCQVLTLASGHPWKSHGDISWVCMVAPLSGADGAWLVPPPPLWGSLQAPCTVFWETQKWAGCAFSHHNTLLTFYSKRAQRRGCVPSHGERDLSVL